MPQDTNYNNPVKQKELMLFGQDAREKLATGVELMHRAVCSTLSPKGRNVAINRNWGAPIVVHDGVTVAVEVKDPNKFVQMGINLVKEAAQKTNDEAGDGTTTSILIAREVVKEGLELVGKGSNPMVLRDQILKAKDQALKGLGELSREVKSQEDLEQVATISSTDAELGKLVGKVVHDAGEHGLVTVEESTGYETYVEDTDGMSIDKGYISPYFVTHPRQMEAIVDKPWIIITDRSISINDEITPLIEMMIKKLGAKSFLLIGTFTGQALQTLVTNKMQGTVSILVVKPPSFGNNVQSFLEDIALVTGGRVISKELGFSPVELANKVDESWFGRADKVAATAKMTTIVGGRGDKQAIKDQIKVLKKQVKNAANQPEKERLLERLAKLSTGVSVIKVGAPTELECREKLERVKDAVGAAQSAREEGVVVGAGTTYLGLQKYITGNTEGDKIMKKALQSILVKILENSGEGEERKYDVLGDVRDSLELKLGYDVVTGMVENLEEKGILDPTKVVRLCIENGCSVATSILTTDALIDYPEHLDSLKK